MAIAPIALREVEASRVTVGHVITSIDYADARDARDLDRQEARFFALCGPVTVTYVRKS